MADVVATRGSWSLVRLDARRPAVMRAAHRFDVESGLTRHPLHAFSVLAEGDAYTWVEGERIIHVSVVVRDALGAYLSWTWTDPAYRRRGLLRATWRALRTLVGPLVITPAASGAMALFVATLPEEERPHEMDADVLSVVAHLTLDTREVASRGR